RTRTDGRRRPRRMNSFERGEPARDAPRFEQHQRSQERKAEQRRSLAFATYGVGAAIAVGIAAIARREVQRAPPMAEPPLAEVPYVRVHCVRRAERMTVFAQLQRRGIALHIRVRDVDGIEEPESALRAHLRRIEPLYSFEGKLRQDQENNQNRGRGVARDPNHDPARFSRSASSMADSSLRLTSYGS